MGRRTSRKVAIGLALIALVTAVLGYDVFLDNNLPPAYRVGTLDW